MQRSSRVESRPLNIIHMAEDMTDTHYRPDLSDHPVHRIAPLDRYVWGRWHHGRVTTRGYALEARLALKALKVRGTPQKFLIFARPRSGTWLLSTLLNQVPGLTCEGEMLHFAVAAPRRFLNNAARCTTDAVYGNKLLSYQLLEIQRVPPVGFFEGLAEDGFRFIHMRRNTLSQCFSLATAQLTRQYRLRPEQKDRPVKEVTIDPNYFVHLVRWNIAMLDFETRLMARVPHLMTDYDRDFSDGVKHQASIDRICDFLDHPRAPVSARLHKLGARNVVLNRDELMERLKAEGLDTALDRVEKEEPK